LIYPENFEKQGQMQNALNDDFSTLGSVINSQGGDSQNFLRKFARLFVTLGLKILKVLSLKVVFDADIIKG